MTQSTQMMMQQQDSQTHADANSLDGLGELLRQAREAQDLTIGQVASSMRLNERVVERLESETVDFSDAPVYLRGYLRNYARLLNQEALLPAAHPQPLAPTDWEPARSESHPWMRLWEGVAHRSAYLVTTLLVIGTVAAYVYQTGRGPADGESLVTRDAINADLLADATGESSQPVRRGAQPASMTPLPISAPMSSAPAAERTLVDTLPAATDNAPVQDDYADASQTAETSTEPAVRPADADPVQAPAQDPAASLGRSELVLRATQDSWVQVEQGDKRLVYDLIQAGEERRVSVQAGAPVRLLLGFAPGIEVLWQGEALDLLPHTREDVARLSLQTP